MQVQQTNRLLHMQVSRESVFARDICPDGFFNIVKAGALIIMSLELAMRRTNAES